MHDDPPPREHPSPEYHLNADEVESTEWDHSDRAPGDFVLSGPLGDEGGGRGRWFSTWDHAATWVRMRHGNRLLRPIPEAGLYGERWAFLIRPTRDK